MFDKKRGVRALRRLRARIDLQNETLEPRTLLAAQTPAIDLVNIAGGGTGGVPKAYGVQETGVTPFSGAGWKVSDVGDVNGDGYDDYAIAAPSVTLDVLGNPTLSPSGAGTGPNTGMVFLVFGSQQVNAGNVLPTIVDYLSLNADQRVGNLTAGTIGGTAFTGLGTTTQLNPTNPTVTDSFQFNGIAFTVGVGSSFNWQLGASITALGDINGDGFADFMIGAPGARTPAAPARRGPCVPHLRRRFALQQHPGRNGREPRLPQQPDLAAGPDAGDQPGQRGPRLVGRGRHRVRHRHPARPRHRRPTALSGNGEVIVIAQAGLPQGQAFPNPQFGSATLNVDTVGQTVSGTTPGVIFTGQPGDEAGFSVAAVGDVSHSTTNTSQSDLVIGARTTASPAPSRRTGSSTSSTPRRWPRSSPWPRAPPRVP